MPVNIHGKQYMTVAERVNEFRTRHPDYTLKTKLVSSDSEIVVMKASILNEGRLISTGYAEERRGASQINRTSALENCETSAIGRALAAFGLGGTEYASANEVENAIHQQVSPDPVNMKKVKACHDMLREEVTADKDEPDYVRMQEGMERLTNDERIKALDLFGDEKIKNPSTGRDMLLRNVVNQCLKWHPADNEEVA